MPSQSQVKSFISVSQVSLKSSNLRLKSDSSQVMWLESPTSDTLSPVGSLKGQSTLFTHYMLPLGQIISRFGDSFYCYADDTQLYIKMDTCPSATLLQPSPLSTITTCLEEIKVWMKHNFLQLNSSKTEVILVGTPHQIQSSSITSITFSRQVIPLATSVPNFGVIFDPHLTFEAHIKRPCKKSFHQLRNIAKLRPSLPFSDAKKLIHTFVSSRLDYCYALLIGTPSKSIQRLQYVQNSAASILMRVRKYELITPILHSLHWLPISARIDYKVSLLTHQCVHGNAPSYLKELLTPQTSSRSLCSTNSHCLHPPSLRGGSRKGRLSSYPGRWNNIHCHSWSASACATLHWQSE